MIDKVGIGLRRDTPLLLQPGLERVFFRVWRTVSRAILSTTSNSTNLSTSNRKVQRFCPSGGVLQATAMSCASCWPSNLRWYWRRGARRCRAASTPSSTQRWLQILFESAADLYSFLRRACATAERLAAKASRKRRTSAQRLRESLHAQNDYIEFAMPFAA